MICTTTRPDVSAKICNIPASDGYPLAATVYEGTDEKTANVAIVTAAMGVRRERYAHFARYLALSGWVVVTFDYRGIGGSRQGSLKESVARLQDWGEKDLGGVIEWVYRNWAARRCVAIGHSVGGQILALAPNHRRLHAALLVGSPKGYTRHWDGVWEWIVNCFWHVLPALVKFFGRLPMKAAGCEDLPPQVALDWRRWALHRDFVDERWQSLGAKYQAFTTPIFSISFADDRLYAPVRACQALLKLYPNAPSKHVHIRPHDLGVQSIGHSGFFDDYNCAELWEISRDWLSTGCQLAKSGNPIRWPATRLSQPAPQYRAAASNRFRSVSMRAGIRSTDQVFQSASAQL